MPTLDSEEKRVKQQNLNDSSKREAQIRRIKKRLSKFDLKLREILDQDFPNIYSKRRNTPVYRS